MTPDPAAHIPTPTGVARVRGPSIRAIVATGTYQVAASVLLVLGLPVLLWRSVRHRREVGERLGLRAPAPPGGGVWFHAASLGELRALEPLLEERRTEAPTQGDLLTVTSVSARKTVLGARYGLTVSYAPLDVWICLLLFWRHLHPRAIVVVETELWPGLFLMAALRRVPVILVSGRISDATWSRRRWWAPFIGPSVRGLRMVMAQSATAARRYRALGASPVAETGNLKHRMPRRAPVAREGDDLFVWVVGSVRQGEETILRVVRDFLSRNATGTGRRPMVVVAPRHLREVPYWRRAGAQAGLDVQSRGDLIGDSTGRLRQLLQDRDAEGLRKWLPGVLAGQMPSAGSPETSTGADRPIPEQRPAILLIDVHGELDLWYAAGDVAFVGGTLNGIGGHSLFEPAALCRPVLYGPDVHGVSDVAESLERREAGWRLSEPAEFLAVLERLRADPARLRQAQAEAGEAARELGGAATRTLAALRQLGV